VCLLYVRTISYHYQGVIGLSPKNDTKKLQLLKSQPNKQSRIFSKQYKTDVKCQLNMIIKSGSPFQNPQKTSHLYEQSTSRPSTSCSYLHTNSSRRVAGLPPRSARLAEGARSSAAHDRSTAAIITVERNWETSYSSVTRHYRQYRHRPVDRVDGMVTEGLLRTIFYR